MILNSQLKKLSQKKLHELLMSTRGKLFVLKFQISSGKSNKFSEVTNLKKDIARVLTFLKRKNTLKNDSFQENK